MILHRTVRILSKYCDHNKTKLRSWPSTLQLWFIILRSQDLSHSTYSELLPESWYCQSWLTVMTHWDIWWNWAIVNTFLPSVLLLLWQIKVSAMKKGSSVVYFNSAEFDPQPWLYVGFQSTLTAMGVTRNVRDAASPQHLTIELIGLVLTGCWRDGGWQRAGKCFGSFWIQVFWSDEAGSWRSPWSGPGRPGRHEAGPPSGAWTVSPGWSSRTSSGH